MIRIKSMRLKGVNSASVAGPGSTSVSSKDADMLYSPSDDAVFVRRKKDQTEYIIPSTDVAFMIPMEPLKCFVDLDAADEERATAPEPKRGIFKK